MNCTIVEVTYINGSKQTGTVHQIKVLEFAKTRHNKNLKIKIIKNGLDWLEVAQFLRIEQSGEIALYELKKDGTFREHKQRITHLKNGEIRVEVGIFDSKSIVQKIKHSPRGQYITLDRQIRYID